MRDTIGVRTDFTKPKIHWRTLMLIPRLPVTPVARGSSRLHEIVSSTIWERIRRYPTMCSDLRRRKTATVLHRINLHIPRFGPTQLPPTISHSTESAGSVPSNSLTTRSHVYIIGNRSNKSRDASLRTEMGNIDPQ